MIFKFKRNINRVKRAVNYWVQFFIDHVKQGSSYEAGLPIGWADIQRLILVTSCSGGLRMCQTQLHQWIKNSTSYYLLTHSRWPHQHSIFQQETCIKHKITVLITMAYYCMALWSYGDYGPGFLYLSVCPFLAALLVGSRSHRDNDCHIMSFSSWLCHSNPIGRYPIFWNVQSLLMDPGRLNLILISGIVSIPYHFLTGLERSINAEKTLKVEL